MQINAFTTVISWERASAMHMRYVRFHWQVLEEQSPCYHTCARPVMNGSWQILRYIGIRTSWLQSSRKYRGTNILQGNLGEMYQAAALVVPFVVTTLETISKDLSASQYTLGIPHTIKNKQVAALLWIAHVLRNESCL